MQAFQTEAMAKVMCAVSATNVGSSKKFLADAKFSLDKMSELNNMIFFGPVDGSFGGSITYKPSIQLMLHDGCIASSNYTECSTLMNGVYANGLMGGLQYFVTVTDLLLTQMNVMFNNGTVPGTPQLYQARRPWRWVAAILCRFHAS